MTPGYTIIDNDAVLDRLPEIDGTAIKVYLALARRADSSGRCWPSVGTIGADTGLHRRGVQLAVGRLRQLTLIEVQERPGTATMYQLTRAPSCAPNERRGAPSCAPGAHDDAQEGRTVVRGGCAPSCAQTRTIEQEPINKNQLTTPKARGCAASVSFPEELDSEIFREAWKRWTAHRTEIKKKLTPTTTAAQLKRLAAWGEARAVAAIERSIEAGWTGIFEEKKNGGNSNGRKNRRNGFPVGPGQKYIGSGQVGVF